jgi:drug/metabolite transporter (DMT)-like permease
VLAAIVLIATRTPWPGRALLPRLALVAAGVVVGFPLFSAWYRGLALGGIGAVGQAQLLQPFLTIFASAWMLGEVIDAATFVAAALVIASIAIGRRQWG